MTAEEARKIKSDRSANGLIKGIDGVIRMQAIYGSRSATYFIIEKSWPFGNARGFALEYYQKNGFTVSLSDNCLSLNW